MPFTEETVYNSDRHVVIRILFARSDTHAIDDERPIKIQVIRLHATARKHLQLRAQIQRNFLQIVPFTEETVYNSDRHVAIMLLFAYSAAHALKEGSHVFVLEFSGQSPCGSPDNHE